MIAIYSLHGQVESARTIVSFEVIRSNVMPNGISSVLTISDGEKVYDTPMMGAKLAIIGQGGAIVAEYEADRRETGKIPVVEWFFVTNS